MERVIAITVGNYTYVKGYVSKIFTQLHDPQVIYIILLCAIPFRSRSVICENGLHKQMSVLL